MENRGHSPYEGQKLPLWTVWVVKTTFSSYKNWKNKTSFGKNSFWENLGGEQK